MSVLQRLLLSPSDPRRLSLLERIAAVSLALAAAALAYFALSCPPEVTKLAETSCCGATPQSVDADTETLVIVLALLSAGLFLVALLGVRFTRISAGKNGFELAVVTEIADEKGPPGDQARLMTGPPEEAEGEWEKLPPWAKLALEEWGAGRRMFDSGVRFYVLRVVRESRKGSRRWIVWVRYGDRIKVLQLTNGRGSSRVSD
jgi:hypothetical protein